MPVVRERPRHERKRPLYEDTLARKRRLDSSERGEHARQSADAARKYTAYGADSHERSTQCGYRARRHRNGGDKPLVRLDPFGERVFKVLVYFVTK